MGVCAADHSENASYRFPHTHTLHAHNAILRASTNSIIFAYGRKHRARHITITTHITPTIWRAQERLGPKFWFVPSRECAAFADASVWRLCVCVCVSECASVVQRHAMRDVSAMTYTHHARVQVLVHRTSFRLQALADSALDPKFAQFHTHRPTHECTYP